MHSVTGELLRTWRGHRINDMALTADGRFLLATPSGESCVHIYQASILMSTVGICLVISQTSSTHCMEPPAH